MEREVDMKDFASYAGKKGRETEDWLREAQEIAARYDGADENEMLRAVYARALEGKKNGTLTNEQIDAFWHAFSPSLDPVRRKKLFKIVLQLKRM